MVEPVRVALLARPGTACDHLQAALQQAGADIVLVADPLGSDAGSVAASSPGAVLVALDPAVEDVLDRYDPVLLDPAVTVIYDEADLAAKREGWDAARWTRHLAAKLAGHDDVLPPGRDSEASSLAAAAPAVEAPDFAPVVDVLPDGEIDLDALEFDGDLGGFELPPSTPAAEAPLEFAAFDAPALAEPVADFEAPVSNPATGPGLAPEAESAPAPAPEAPAAPSVFANLTLDEIPEDTVRPRASTLSWEDGGSHGAVVVLAGIGGPDALRQFLSALPAGFSRPVVVRQRLDGAKHDRLVRQLQRATALPVELAEAGHALASGHVYILPDAVAVAADGAGANRFVAADGAVPVLAGLPARDSAILMLSGSDPAMVADALAARADGAMVGAQSSEDCFDCEAPAALAAGGAEAGTPADLASRVSTRWLSLEF